MILEEIQVKDYKIKNIKNNRDIYMVSCIKMCDFQILILIDT